MTNAAIMTYDVALDANQLDFDMLRRSFPGMLFKGVLGGPIRARGAMSDLELTANLQGAAGSMSFDGRVDLDSVGGYGAHGKGDVAQLDLKTLLVDTTKPPTVLNGHYDLDLAFQSLATLTGTAAVSLERSRVEKQAIDSGHASLLFADGQARLAEDLLVTGAIGALRARKGGGIGLPGGPPDSVHLSVTDIKLDELRSYLTSLPPEDTITAASLWIDSTATVSGRVDSLAVRGTLSGSSVLAAGVRAKSLAAFFDINQPLTKPSGLLAIRGDSLLIGGLDVATTDDTLRLADSTHGTFVVRGNSDRHPDFDAQGQWSRLEGATSLLTESARLVLPSTQWALAAPASVVFAPAATRIDSFEFTNGAGGLLGFRGLVPDAGSASFTAYGHGIPLTDVATVAQLRGTYGGLAAFSANATDTRLNPIITLDSLTVEHLEVAHDSVGRAVVTGRYPEQDRRRGPPADSVHRHDHCSDRACDAADRAHPLFRQGPPGFPGRDDRSHRARSEGAPTVCLRHLTLGHWLGEWQTLLRWKADRPGVFRRRRPDPGRRGHRSTACSTTYTGVRARLHSSGDTLFVDSLHAVYTYPKQQSRHRGCGRHRIGLGEIFEGRRRLPPRPRGRAACERKTINPNFALHIAREPVPGHERSVVGGAGCLHRTG